ncbi:MAG: hypothetical protein HRT44_12355 [Bdellovibrionales bacterium]|nr:hypothetical protein [Bdellovibrionales bacterium]NQZ20030.1 hypothetical protein [Bdellovibrionales bacterium]
MDIWSAYYKESLGEPWIIQSETQHDEVSAVSIYEPSESIIFLTKTIQLPALKTMMEKMAAAIKLKPPQVNFFEVDELDFSFMATWASPKKVMVFGKDFSPENFGLLAKLGPHNLLVTHSLMDLNKNQDLKKVTWAHLKEFAGQL